MLSDITIGSQFNSPLLSVKRSVGPDSRHARLARPVKSTRATGSRSVRQPLDEQRNSDENGAVGGTEPRPEEPFNLSI
jgi:hypothetical protein